MNHRIAILALGLLCAPVAFGAKGVVNPAPTAAPAVAVINGNPLTINVGSDFTFQVYNSAVPGTGQIYPPDSGGGTADMGWFVRSGSTKYAPDFTQHGGTATGNIGANTAWTAGTQSGVSGNGSAATPYTVTTTNTLPTLNLTATQVVTYVNGQNYFRKSFTLANASGAAVSVRTFLGADIYLAGSDSGIPVRVSGAPGGKDCGAGTYNILMIPTGSVAPTGYSATGYSSIWSQIGAGALDNAVNPGGCMDNGSALQWDYSVPGGGSATIEGVTSFGAIPTDVVAGATVGIPTLTPMALGAMILALALFAVGIIRRRV